jgi:hypothetical protein
MRCPLTEHRQQATTWACAVIQSAGCTLHSVPGGWDVCMPDGSWEAANSWQELCKLAERL